MTSFASFVQSFLACVNANHVSMHTGKHVEWFSQDALLVIHILPQTAFSKLPQGKSEIITVGEVYLFFNFCFIFFSNHHNYHSELGCVPLTTNCAALHSVFFLRLSSNVAKRPGRRFIFQLWKSSFSFDKAHLIITQFWWVVKRLITSHCIEGMSGELPLKQYHPLGYEFLHRINYSLRLRRWWWSVRVLNGNCEESAKAWLLWNRSWLKYDLWEVHVTCGQTR